MVGNSALRTSPDVDEPIREDRRVDPASAVRLIRYLRSKFPAFGYDRVREALTLVRMSASTIATIVIGRDFTPRRVQ